jgi:hypothetical protein
MAHSHVVGAGKNPANEPVPVTRPPFYRLLYKLLVALCPPVSQKFEYR